MRHNWEHVAFHRLLLWMDFEWLTESYVKLSKLCPITFFSIISNDTNFMSKPYPKVHSIVINPFFGHMLLPNTDFIPIPLTWASVRANILKISSSVGNHFSGSFSAILTHNRRRKFSTKRHVIVLHCILPSTETKKKIGEMWLTFLLTNYFTKRVNKCACTTI